MHIGMTIKDGKLMIKNSQFWIFDAHSNFNECVEILSNSFPHGFLLCIIANFADMECQKGS